MKNRGPVVLITDFGANDYFVGLVKGVIRKENRDVEIIDLTHGVRAYSVQNALYIIHAALPHFPEGSVFLVVIDPGVGSSRRGLIVRRQQYDFVLPDNGIISSAFQDGMSSYSIDYKQFPGVRATFHARDVFGPVAARLAGGTSPDKLGTAISDPLLVPFPEFRETDNGLEGIIYHIDHFGNAILSIPNKKIDAGRRYAILGQGLRFEARSAPSYSAIPKDNVGLIAGSSDFIELALDRGSLAERFKLNIEDKITLIHE